MNSEEKWEDELGKTLFFSILSDLVEVKEALTDFEVKRLILNGLKRNPDLEVEWGDVDRFGKSTILIKRDSNLLIIEVTPLINTIRILWNEYQSKNASND